MIARATCLLTGGTGLVGSALLPLLLENRPERRIVILSRSAGLHGDLAARNLALAPEVTRELADSVTEIIHCAADIRFRLPLAQARAANTAGTRRLLALARRCKRLEKFAHISTVYVAGKQCGRIAEAPLDGAAGFLNSYQQSKFEAEELVFAAMRDIPGSVFRLSTIISDSRGAVRQFNYFHQVLKLAHRNPFPMIPGDPDARLDLIASDWAAAALSRLYESHFTPGRVYHVCAGANASLTVREILDLTFELLRRHGRAAAPELVPLEEFDRYARRFVRSGNATVKELLRVIREFLPQLAIPQCYENRKTLSLLRRDGLELPAIREFYPRVVEACLGARREN